MRILPLNSTSQLTKSRNLFQRVIEYGGPALLPILAAIVPTLYHYSNNVEKLTLANLSRMLVFNGILALLIYLVMMAFHRFQAAKAASAAFVFLIFFNVYGIAYKYLLHLDLIPIKHYTLLPFVMILSIYAILFVTKLKNSVLAGIWKNLALIASVLVLFNLIKIIPGEIKRTHSNLASAPVSRPGELLPARNYPDIYYIVFDEFAGFQAMREYWKYDGVDDFVSYLKNRGFFVAEQSHGSSTDTLHQMATRLNYQEYPSETMSIRDLFKEIADNQAMRDLKARGYTTVVFDETNMAYPSAISMTADFLYEHGSSSIPQRKAGTYWLYLDEFGELVLDNTMMYAFLQNYKTTSPIVAQHTDMIYFTMDHIVDKEIASPKFVHVHLMLPHSPFAFSEDGSIMDRDRFTNWNYYIENYKFSIRIAREMIDKILREADPKNPPIIIIQSDHGARNHLNHREGSAILPNYPEEFKSLIMNALYIPGYDYSSLPQDIDPINTFPIVFNYLFDTAIPLAE